MRRSHVGQVEKRGEKMGRTAEATIWPGLGGGSGASSESMRRLGRREHRVLFVTRAYVLVRSPGFMFLWFVFYPVPLRAVWVYILTMSPRGLSCTQFP